MGKDCMELCRCCPNVGCCFCDQKTGVIIIGSAFVILGGVELVLLGTLYIKDSPIIIAIGVLFILSELFTGAFLLFGVLQDERVIVKLSLILMIPNILLHATALIMLIVEYIAYTPSKSPEDLIFSPIWIIFWLALMIYFFLVVLTYYRSMPAINDDTKE